MKIVNSKNDCSCGKAKYSAPNVHEEEALKILDCRDVTDEEIEMCKQFLKDFKLTEAKTTAPKVKTQETKTRNSSWLFNKVETHS